MRWGKIPKELSFLPQTPGRQSYILTQPFAAGTSDSSLRLLIFFIRTPTPTHPFVTQHQSCLSSSFPLPRNHHPPQNSLPLLLTPSSLLPFLFPFHLLLLQETHSASLQVLLYKINQKYKAVLKKKISRLRVSFTAYACALPQGVAPAGVGSTHFLFQTRVLIALLGTAGVSTQQDSLSGTPDSRKNPRFITQR